MADCNASNPIAVQIFVKKVIEYADTDKKFLFFFKRKEKILTYRLIFKNLGAETYEIYHRHKDIYKRLATEALYNGESLPKEVTINEFIDLGFSVYMVRE